MIGVKIGFLEVTIWDVLDVLIVGYLMYRVYKLLRGSITFNIFIGLLIILVFYWLVDVLNMLLLYKLFNSFAQIGVFTLVVIFQPEIRRFLLYLGDSTLNQSNLWRKILDRSISNADTNQSAQIDAIITALIHLSKHKIGALVVLANHVKLVEISRTGIALNAEISPELLISIFNKESPLHDGAVLIHNHQIHAASCILPVSENNTLPTSVGLRHRAAIGISEKVDIAALIVSEETGYVSYAYRGVLLRKLSEEKLLELLQKHY